ncbi:MAG: patatin-like phospholipase family protein [Deltaproteobacteria bacterium]
MKELGLALGGGGLKGLAHIGVLQVLEASAIPVTMISGTSAGSLVAALYASGMSPRQMETAALSLKPSDYLDYNVAGLLKALVGFLVPGLEISLDGVLKGDKLEQLVYYLTGGQSLRDVKIPLSIIACDINTGREVIFTNCDLSADNDTVIIHEALLSEAVRASCSIPATFVPLDFRGMQMVDGGVRSIVPVKAQQQMGAEYTLAVNLGQETYKEPVQGIPQIVGRTLNILTYETSSTDQAILADLAIYPGVTGVKLDDLSKAEEIIRAGRRAMRENLPQLEAGLRGRRKIRTVPKAQVI